MVATEDRVIDALNETRILILGAQILLGFQFEATFQPGFEQLAPNARWRSMPAPLP